MKKIALGISITALSMLLMACDKVQNKTSEKDVILTPTPIVTEPTDNQKESDSTNVDNITGIDVKNNTKNALTVADYFPLKADMEYIFEGSGNEYASYRTFIDYMDTNLGRIQTRTNNGGSETVKVIEVKNGKVSVVYVKSECYYRDNFLDKEAVGSETDVLLMEPLIEGTKWTLVDGRSRYISGIDVTVQTPSGTYQALEVTTEGEDYQTKDYYAKDIGLVQSVFLAGDMEVTSTLKEMKKNSPFQLPLDVFYPSTDEKIHKEQLTLSFHTNDISRNVIQNAITKEHPKGSFLSLFSTNTKLNSLYLGKDEIVYADFSSELITEMNAGSGYELLILQSIANTLGNYYEVSKVYITVDGKPYSSGHVLMKKGETIKVDYSKVVK